MHRTPYTVHRTDTESEGGSYDERCRGRDEYWCMAYEEGSEGPEKGFFEDKFHDVSAAWGEFP